MNMVKGLGMILLAIYLFVIGLVGISGLSLSVVALNILNLIALIAGVLIFISVLKSYGELGHT